MADTDSESSTGVLKPLHYELLCFITDKSGGSMAVNDIVEICDDFYKEDEVVAAGVLLNDHCILDSKHHLRKIYTVKTRLPQVLINLHFKCLPTDRLPQVLQQEAAVVVWA